MTRANASQLDLFNQPKTRTRDRGTSKAAAAAVSPGANLLEDVIVVAVGLDECTDEMIVDRVRQAHGDRWLGSTIISARKRAVDAGLLIDTGITRRNRRNRAMTVWRFR